MENLSQNNQIRKHLEAGNTITPLEALQKFNCLRLGARIHNLKAMGLSICSRLVEQNGKHFAEYSMENSECHSRVRYGMTEKLMDSLKTSALILVFGIALISCESQRHLVYIAQLETQYEHSRKSDPYLMEKNWAKRPHGKTRLPFTQIYIY